MTVFRGTNWLLCLVLCLVAAVTGLNQYTTQKHCDMYLDGVSWTNNEMARNKMVFEALLLVDEGSFRADLLADVAQSEAARAERLEAEFDDLTNRYVQANANLREAGLEIYHLNECINECRSEMCVLQRRLQEVTNERDALKKQVEQIGEPTGSLDFSENEARK